MLDARVIVLLLQAALLLQLCEAMAKVVWRNWFVWKDGD